MARCTLYLVSFILPTCISATLQHGLYSVEILDDMSQAGQMLIMAGALELLASTSAGILLSLTFELQVHMNVSSGSYFTIKFPSLCPILSFQNARISPLHTF